MEDRSTPVPGCTCPPSCVRDDLMGHPADGCPFKGKFGLELANAHRAARAAAALSCNDIDLDAVLLEHRESARRGARTMIARASRLIGTGTARDQLEGFRVELLSYRDRYSAELPEITHRDMIKAAQNLKRAAAAPVPAIAERASSPLEALAIFDDRPDTVACDRCGQTFIPHTGSTRCATCDAADADQGAQLGMFEIAPTTTAPRKTARRATPQPEGLFA